MSKSPISRHCMVSLSLSMPTNSRTRMHTHSLAHPHTRTHAHTHFSHEQGRKQWLQIIEIRQCLSCNLSSPLNMPTHNLLCPSFRSDIDTTFDKLILFCLSILNYFLHLSESSTSLLPYFIFATICNYRL